MKTDLGILAISLGMGLVILTTVMLLAGAHFLPKEKTALSCVPHSLP